jgi:Uma2 family endonuclease
MTQTLENTNELKPFRVTLEEFFRMGDEGFFEGRRVELIDGEILEMPPQGPFHIRRVSVLNSRFVRLFDDVAMILTQSTLILDVSTRRAVEPDLALIRRPADETEFDRRSPDATDALLVVEVSDKTLHHDRTTKLEWYAAQEIPEYWIYDVNANKLEVYRTPSNGTYASKVTLEVGQTCAPLAFADRNVEWWV